MGQAKNRGTREQRIAQSVERQRLEAEEVERAKERRRQEAREWWASLTPEQQAAERRKERKRQDSRMVLAAMMAMAESGTPGITDMLMGG